MQNAGVKRCVHEKLWQETVREREVLAIKGGIILK
jgi:hypothetical protein